jgi:hypothetical protein
MPPESGSPTTSGIPDWLQTLGNAAGSIAALPLDILGAIAGIHPQSPAGTWQHDDRKRVALSMIPDHLQPEERAQRLEVYRVMPLHTWTSVTEQFQKRDQQAADLYASPDAQRLLQGPEGLAAFQQRYPSVPLPPTTTQPVDGYVGRTPVDDLDQAIAKVGGTSQVPVPVSTMRQAVQLPPVDRQLQLKDVQASDELALREKAGPGNVDTYKAGRTALATGAVDRYFKTGDPRSLDVLLGGGAPAPEAPTAPTAPLQGSEARDAERKRAEDARAAEIKIRAAQQKYDEQTSGFIKLLDKMEANLSVLPEKGGSIPGAIAGRGEALLVSTLPQAFPKQQALTNAGDAAAVLITDLYGGKGSQSDKDVKLMIGQVPRMGVDSQETGREKLQMLRAAVLARRPRGLPSAAQAGGSTPAPAVSPIRQKLIDKYGG